VDLELVGKQVLLRYDPFDLKVIQVWWKEKRFLDACTVDLIRSCHRKVARNASQEFKKGGESFQLSFLDLAEQKRQAAWQKDPVSFVCKEDIDNE